MTSQDELPLVSVVMPIRNEEHFIERCLGAVLQQDYPADKIEVLIADGMSDDRTVEIIESLTGADRVRIVPNPERIQSYGLNHIIPLAKGDYIVRIDGHTIIEADYIRQCVKTLQETGADNVGGGMDAVGITAIGKAIATAGNSAFAVPLPFMSVRRRNIQIQSIWVHGQRVFLSVSVYSTRNLSPMKITS
ncbi:MAG: glycosyltransferase [Anaerolineae bacterium]|nr:glycosyltransferase [Anaerolineae bacterium]